MLKDEDQIKPDFCEALPKERCNHGDPLSCSYAIEGRRTHPSQVFSSIVRIAEVQRTLRAIATVYEPSAHRAFHLFHVYSTVAAADTMEHCPSSSRRRLVLRVECFERGFLNASGFSGTCFSGIHLPFWTSRAPNRESFEPLEGDMCLEDNWQTEAVKFTLTPDVPDEAEKVHVYGIMRHRHIGQDCKPDESFSPNSRASS